MKASSFLIPLMEEKSMLLARRLTSGAPPKYSWMFYVAVVSKESRKDSTLCLTQPSAEWF